MLTIRQWLEYDVKVFNAGQLRRSKSKRIAELFGTKEDHSASFFDRDNAEASAKREKLSEECLESLISWLKEGGNVGIHGMAAFLTYECLEESIRRHQQHSL
jgi:6-phosphofructo-2-kinase/fructose-2,6-biphosphatase 2